jgi:hypothetical protein
MQLSKLIGLKNFMEAPQVSFRIRVRIVKFIPRYEGFFANRTLTLKETPNSTKHLKKNENYNEILEKPFIFNLQTVSMARHHCRSSLSRPDVVGCGRDVAERVKKTTSVPKTKKKEELPMKLPDDLKIPTAR